MSASFWEAIIRESIVVAHRPLILKALNLNRGVVLSAGYYGKNSAADYCKGLILITCGSIRLGR
jgi:hypothetical protein